MWSSILARVSRLWSVIYLECIYEGCFQMCLTVKRISNRGLSYIPGAVLIEHLKGLKRWTTVPNKENHPTPESSTSRFNVSFSLNFLFASLLDQTKRITNIYLSWVLKVVLFHIHTIFSLIYVCRWVSIKNKYISFWFSSLTLSF